MGDLVSEEERIACFALRVLPLPCIAEITRLRTKLKAAGLFAHDRELLECPHCGLQEDVLASGLLITCRPESPGVDTGLRFQSVKRRKQWWRCPTCGAAFQSEDAL